MDDFPLTRVGPASVALTFDDGPDPRWTPALLDELARRSARATFFVVSGRSPRLLRRMLAEGHEVAYHCGRHVRHSCRELDDVRREVRADLRWLEEAGIEPRSWRTPWGDLAPWSRRLAAEMGLELWGWSDDTEDWAGPAAETMLERLRPALSGGAVILMHDGIGPGATRADPRETVRLVGRLLDLCEERGLEPAPIHPPTGRRPAGV